MTNHISEAQALLADAGGTPEWQQTSAAMAQAHATLAVAEQLKLANRIALVDARAGAGASPETREVLQQISAELEE